MNRCPLNLTLGKSIDGFLNYKLAEGLTQRSVSSYEWILRGRDQSGLAPLPQQPGREKSGVSHLTHPAAGDKRGLFFYNSGGVRR